ncbi:MAG TPA: terpene synthase family protein [Kofleriaceae bacterium]|nr:terpene synthase family protein [Kofleriaceae bacterium]
MRGDVQIVSAAEFARRSVVAPASFQLRFPPTWRASPVQNRYADAIERQTLCWLASHGIGTTAEERDKLEKFRCGMYGGYSLPLADYHTGLLVTEFISLWLFWDDAQVEEEFGWTVDSVVAALTGPTANPPSRYVAAWADLGARLRATQSERWLARLGATMRQWLDNARTETAMAKAYRDLDACPEVAALFDCRTISIGMFPTFHLIEYAEGFELPDELHAHAAVVELKRLASRLVGLGNDLGGLAKDIRNRWLNLVLVEAERSSLSITDAFERIVAIHNHDVRAFDQLARQLASRLPALDRDTGALLRGWVQAVRHNVYGFALWESTAERYQEYRAISGPHALIAPVTLRRSRLARRAHAAVARDNPALADLASVAV